MQSLYELAVQANQFHQRTGGYGVRTTLPGAIGVTIICRAFNSDNLTPDGKKFTVHSDAKARERECAGCTTSRTGSGRWR